MGMITELYRLLAAVDPSPIVELSPARRLRGWPTAPPPA